MGGKVLIFLFFIIISSTYSQTCCSGGVPLSNNIGLQNEKKGTWVFGLSYDYNNLNTLNSGDLKLDDNARLRVTNSILLNIGYSLTDRLSFETLLTWVNQKRTISQFGNDNLTETKGIGDAVFLLKYAFPELLGKYTSLNLGLGTKAPLGNSDIVSEQGIQLIADLQAGSGSWDGLGWVSVSKNLNSRPTATVSANFTYRYTGVNNSYLNNSATYEFGNEIQGNLGYTDEFLIFNTLFNPGLVLKYRKALGDKIDDVILPSTGGDWVFVRPELSARLSPKIQINTKVELPLYSYVDGTQLTPTVRFTVGLLFKLNKKIKVEF
jgi:hypothetical protein